jgi:hypothetical protein
MFDLVYADLTANGPGSLTVVGHRLGITRWALYLTTKQTGGLGETIAFQRQGVQFVLVPVAPLAPLPEVA